MFASWVAQASFKPLGCQLPWLKTARLSPCCVAGDRFVINVLEEGNYQGLMKHFLKRFPQGADRFRVRTYPATNGSPILADALAYLGASSSRTECSDHWIIYGTVKWVVSRCLTAVHHRKVGNHY